MLSVFTRRQHPFRSFEINLILSRNDALDKERWASANKRLEDRRADIRKLYDIVQSKRD